MAFSYPRPPAAAAVATALVFAFAVGGSVAQKRDIRPSGFPFSKGKLHGLTWYEGRSLNDQGLVQYGALHTDGKGNPIHALVSNPPNLVTLVASGEGKYILNNIGELTVLAFTPEGGRKPLLKFMHQTKRPSIFEPDHHGILEVPGNVLFTFGKSLGNNRQRTDHWFIKLGNASWDGIVFPDRLSKLEALKDPSPLWSKKVDRYVKYAKKTPELARNSAAGALLAPIYKRYQKIFDLLYALQGDRFGNDANVPVDLSTLVAALEVPRP